jgi:hypothetical protein
MGVLVGYHRASMEHCCPRQVCTSCLMSVSLASSSKLKLIDLSRILNELRRKYEREQNYTKAKILKYKFDTLSKQEQ